MLTVLGFAMIATFLVLIMTKKMSPIASLVLIPALFCVAVGQGAKLGDYVIEGVGTLAPTAAMLMFAIVYFGVMIDVGLFDPIVRAILRFCKADPMRIVVGTALLAAIVSLDGDGSTTFMITVSAMYPLYKRLKMSLVVMTCVAATANGVMNTLPWGGPTARAATALKVDAADIFVPMIPALAMGLLAVVLLAFVLGPPRAQAARHAHPRRGAGDRARDRPRRRGRRGPAHEDAEGPPRHRDRPRHRCRRRWCGECGRRRGRGRGAGVQGPRPQQVHAAPQALLVQRRPHRGPAGRDDHGSHADPRALPDRRGPRPHRQLPRMPDQRARIAAHADNVLNVSGMVFAAAVFTGVLTGTGMVEHMADWLVGAIPDAMGPHMAVVTGVLSLPLTYFMSNDGFYFGVLPVLAEAGAAHGVSHLEIARASIAGQPLHMSSPLVPAVYVLVGMAKVEFGDHTRFTVKWAVLTSLVVLGAGILFGII